MNYVAYRYGLGELRRKWNCRFWIYYAIFACFLNNDKMPPKPRKQTFKPEYTKRWHFIVKSSRNSSSARCTLCCSDFSIAHGGKSDIDGKGGHLHTAKHKNAATAAENSHSIMAHFTKPDYRVIRAETLMSCFLIEHNLPFSAADHLSHLVKAMFPDSNIASKFSCKRTKATSITKTLAHEIKGR